LVESDRGRKLKGSVSIVRVPSKADHHRKDEKYIANDSKHKLEGKAPADYVTS